MVVFYLREAGLEWTHLSRELHFPSITAGGDVNRLYERKHSSSVEEDISSAVFWKTDGEYPFKHFHLLLCVIISIVCLSSSHQTILTSCVILALQCLQHATWSTGTVLNVQWMRMVARYTCSCLTVWWIHALRPHLIICFPLKKVYSFVLVWWYHLFG